LLKALSDWLDARTGYRALVHGALEEPIPGGARWRYVFGSALSTVFVIQAATGLLLMCSYAPSSSTAWGSVYYVSHVMSGGWFLRGVHHFGSQAMVVLLAMHLLQVLWAGAYRAPREVNWWFGMALLGLTLGFSLTGYLLPWDQKGYWATKVATNIMGGAPALGPYLQKALVGGPDYGNQTLTRFYGLHVGLLPALFVMCLAGHVALFRRHGLTPPRHHDRRPEGKFWPEQLFMDTVFSVLVFGVIVLMVVAEHGANLDAPADPSSGDYPARPEWYFLSLFQMLKLFPGDREVYGTIVIPTAVLVVLLLVPLLDKALPRGLAHFLACGFVFALVGGAGYLTYEAWRADASDPTFQAARARADEARQRALRLAGDKDVMVPPDGASYLLMRDPLYHGRGVLEQKCLGCHVHGGKGTGTQVASDLKNFGSLAWVHGLLDNPRSATYFGKTKCDGMARWKASTKLTPAELTAVAEFVATFADIPADMSPEEWLGARWTGSTWAVSPPAGVSADQWAQAKGVADLPGSDLFQKECGKCHAIPGLTEGGTEDAPGLFAWGSPQWVTRMIHKPGAPDLYGFLDPGKQMPGFAGQLTDNDVRTVVHYLLNDYPGAAGPTPHWSATPRVSVSSRREARE
jgi:quinol-cytochrome oxidoreductase complex cytochrome b subunit/mono/diheme cytochrome c family protein